MFGSQCQSDTVKERGEKEEETLIAISGKMAIRLMEYLRVKINH